MSRSQLILIVSTLVIVAIVLHVSLCEWGYKARYRSPLAVGDPLLAYHHPEGRVYTGLFSQRRLGNYERSASLHFFHLFLGVILPLLLLATATWLLLDWPRRSRLRQGRCPDCGYDLRGAGENACPECGWTKRA